MATANRQKVGHSQHTYNSTANGDCPLLCFCSLILNWCTVNLVKGQIIICSSKKVQKRYTKKKRKNQSKCMSRAHKIGFVLLFLIQNTITNRTLPIAIDELVIVNI